MAKKIILAYIPVIHRGYRRFFEENSSYDTLYLLDESITGQYRELQKEIRALTPHLAKEALEGWNLLKEIRVVGEKELVKLKDTIVELLFPDDAISHDLVSRYFKDTKTAFHPIFLRWDRRNSDVHNVIDPNAILSEDEFTKKIMSRVQREGLKSTNIWRRVGAALVKDGQVIAYASNKHRPSEYSAWIDGDVRANFSKGVGIEMSTDQHAESCVIAEAARRGVGLEGADLYVDTFPCPPCSMLIAYSGIRRLFYAQGYAVLDGQRIMRDHDMEIFRVDAGEIEDNERTYVPYPV